MLIRALLSALAVLLVLILAFQNPIHAVTPHSHSHSHSGEEVSTLWASFHAALRAEERETLAGISFFAIVALVSLVALRSSFIPLPVPVRAASRSTRRSFELLRRGIAEYRRFV
jgi:hypothetical protein